LFLAGKVVKQIDPSMHLSSGGFTPSIVEEREPSCSTPGEAGNETTAAAQVDFLHIALRSGPDGARRTIGDARHWHFRQHGGLARNKVQPDCE